jgi:hypothetical protein
MKSPLLIAFALGSLLCTETMQAGGIDFGPALGTYPAHYSHWNNIWWSDYDQGPDGLIDITRSFVKNDVKFTGQPYVRPVLPGIDLEISSSKITPDLTTGFFRPAL